VFSVEFRITVWRNRFLRSRSRIQPQRANNSKKFRNFFYRFLTRDKGMEIESSKDFQIAVEGQQHTLTINDPYPEDTGVFLISASNNFGKATSTGM